MMRKPVVLLLAALLFFGSCAMLQSVVKGTFPYTANMVIPASAKVGELQTAVSTGNSFDQDFTKDGNNASRLSEVRIVSAKLQSNDPSDYNIGNLSSVRIYMAKSDGSDEVMVAIRNDISPNAGNSIVLDIDNSHFLDALVRQQNVRVRMVYQLRKGVNTDVILKASLGIGAN